MPIFIEGAVFFHVPKTAGWWVHEVLLAAPTLNLYPTVGADIPYHHLPPAQSFREVDPRSRDYWFCFVRHPATWYQSMWAFRMKAGWTPESGTPMYAKDLDNVEGVPPIDRHMHIDFNHFVARMVDDQPGWLSRLYAMYTDDPRMNFVGRYESIREDLRKVLLRVRPDLTERVDAVGPVNTASMDSAYREATRYDPTTLSRLLASEREALERYGYE